MKVSHRKTRAMDYIRIGRISRVSAERSPFSLVERHVAKELQRDLQLLVHSTVRYVRVLNNVSCITLI